MAKRGGFPGGGMPGNMANLMKQAQKMQRQMEEQAKEMETKEFSATAGGGAVEVTMSGKKVVQSAMTFRNPHVSMGTADLDEYSIWQTDTAEIKKAADVLRRPDNQ